jgi:penicillin amidase
VKRLRKWKFTTPTGIAEGYDARRRKGNAAESVATTIYSTWRGTMVANSIDATLDGLGLVDVPRPGEREELVTALKHLLEHDGVGVSGLNFFNVPGVDDAATRRDILVLASLADALDLLASDAFAPAFANSENQDDYRWGRLHRIVFRHPLGAVEPNFNAPPAFGFVPAPLAGLDGIPTDGGFETVDEGPPEVDNVRVRDSDSFMFEFGPTGRYVARVGAAGVQGETSLPGGESAIPGSPWYFNLLEPWLRNETFPLE